jgi:4-hydroxyphenylpyruvate dioxygenase-like putative hemolysin
MSSCSACHPTLSPSSQAHPQLHSSSRKSFSITGIRVDDARQAFEVSTANGAEGVLPPTELRDDASNTSAVVSEIRAYGDCVLRFISGTFQVGHPRCCVQPNMLMQVHHLLLANVLNCPV